MSDFITADTKRSALWWAFVNLFFIPGLSHFFIGQWKKGLAYFVFYFLLDGIFIWLFGAAGLPLRILSAIDIYLIVQKLNQNKAVRHWEFF